MITTLDDFLGGKLKIQQPTNGFRSGVDAILLAAFAKPKEKAYILEVGAGVGVVALSLAIHNASARIKALEIQHDLVELATANSNLNHLEDRVEFIEGDLFAPPYTLEKNTFDYVVSNPPYFDYGTLASGKNASRSTARHLQQLDLKAWIEGCLKFVKPRGHLALIHRADHLDEILSVLKTQTGAIKICPLWPTENDDAKLVLIEARKGVKTQCQLTKGKVMHKADGSYTDSIEKVLRGDATF